MYICLFLEVYTSVCTCIKRCLLTTASAKNYRTCFWNVALSETFDHVALLTVNTRAKKARDDLFHVKDCWTFPIRNNATR